MVPWERLLSRLAVACELELPSQLLRDAAAAMARQGSHAGPELLGEIYERELARSQPRRRARGCYYTPAYLVDFVIEQTVGKALRGRSVEHALALRVIDPACGGGAFLLGALRRIEAHCRQRGEKGDLRRRIATSVLCGVDLDPAAVAVTRLALAVAVGGPCELDVRVGDALFSEVCGAPGSFDVVVGNPPWGQKQFRFPARLAARARQRFVTARGPLDPFKLFVERAVELTAAGGRWGMVLPDIVLLKDQRPVRDLILETTALEWIVDAGRAFAGVNLDAVVVAGRRCAAGPPPRQKLRAWDRLPTDWRSAAPAGGRTIPQALFSELPGHKFNIHLSAPALALLRRLGGPPRLGERFAVHEGVHSGNAREKLFLPGPGGKNRACAPLVVGKGEIARYRLAWAGRYLALDPAALDRDAGDYANLGRPEWHRAAKLVVRRTGDRIVAAFDPDGYYVSNNLFVVLPRAAMEADEMRAHTALLNSRLMTWYYRKVQPRTGKLFAELKICHLTEFPLPSAAVWRPGTIARLAALAHACEGEGASGERDRGIDELVEAELFGLSAAERGLLAETSPV